MLLELKIIQLPLSDFTKKGDAFKRSPFSIVFEMLVTPIYIEAFLADLTVFFMSMIIVIGPTPPGTGEIALTF